MKQAFPFFYTMFAAEFYQTDKTMRTVTGMGETIMDIVFHQNKPLAAVPGGSSFNTILSLARAGINVRFIGETGADEVGKRIIHFLRENRVDTTYMQVRPDIKSAVSLAFLDEHNDAHYQFYKQDPSSHSGFQTAAFSSDDILVFGSYYAIAPAVHKQVKGILRTARQAGSILYYDLNFRKSHRHELSLLMDNIHENFYMSDIVRGSADDFEIMFGTRDAETVYHRYIADYCSLFICTDGAQRITLCRPEGTLTFSVPPVQTVSNIGAGDNFNAGFIYGLLKSGISRPDLHNIDTRQWDILISYGIRFAANVCASLYNCIDKEFGEELQRT